MDPALRQRMFWRLGRLDRRVHGRGPLLVAIGDSLTDPGCGSTSPRQVWLRHVARAGYRTVNLGVSGDTLQDMRVRVEQMAGQGRPSVAVVFGGANDAFQGVAPSVTRGHAASILSWLESRQVNRVAVVSPGLVNWRQDARSLNEPLARVREVLREVAEQHGAVFVDLIGYLAARVERGADPDLSRSSRPPARSWHVTEGDPHFNAYGQRLVAQAFLEATAGWRH